MPTVATSAHTEHTEPTSDQTTKETTTTTTTTTTTETTIITTESTTTVPVAPIVCDFIDVDSCSFMLNPEETEDSPYYFRVQEDLVVPGSNYIITDWSSFSMNISHYKLLLHL